MPVQLKYVIQFVADMEQSVQFYRDTLGFSLRFQSPEWTEFETGTTLLALHPASQANPPGKTQLGLSVPNLQEFHTGMVSKGFRFTQSPVLEQGSTLARFVDADGIEYSVSGEPK